MAHQHKPNSQNQGQFTAAPARLKLFFSRLKSEELTTPLLSKSDRREVSEMRARNLPYEVWRIWGQASVEAMAYH